MTSLALLVLSLFEGVARARVITVEPGDPAGPQTIQAGVDLAGEGDLVLVKPGIYAERVTIDGKRNLVLRGMAAVLVGVGPESQSGAVPDAPRGIAIGPGASQITVEGFIFRDLPWGVLVAARRPGKAVNSPPAVEDRGISIRYNTFFRTPVGVGACAAVTLEANIFSTDLHDVYDCGTKSSVTLRYNRLDGEAGKPRAVLRRPDTALSEVGNVAVIPAFRNPSADDLRLRDGSPLTTAGPDGHEIGAYGVPALRPAPEVVLPLPPFRLPWPGGEVAGAGR